MWVRDTTLLGTWNTVSIFKMLSHIQNIIEIQRPPIRLSSFCVSSGLTKEQ